MGIERGGNANLSKIVGMDAVGIRGDL